MKKHKRNDIPALPIAAGIAIIAIVAIALFVVLRSPGSQPDSVLVTVNGEPITQSDLDSLYQRLPPDVQDPSVKPALLNRTISDRLLLQEARSQGISVTQEQIEEQFQGAILQSGTTEAAVRSALASRNITLEEIKRDLGNQLIIFNLINKTVISQTTVSDEEITNYYNVQGLTEYNLTLTNSTKQQIRSILMNEKISAGVELFLKQLQGKSTIVYVKAPN